MGCLPRCSSASACSNPGCARAARCIAAQALRPCDGRARTGRPVRANLTRRTRTTRDDFRSKGRPVFWRTRPRSRQARRGRWRHTGTISAAIPVRSGRARRGTSTRCPTGSWCFGSLTRCSGAAGLRRFTRPTGTTSLSCNGSTGGPCERVDSAACLLPPPPLLQEFAPWRPRSPIIPRIERAT